MYRVSFLSCFIALLVVPSSIAFAPTTISLASHHANSLTLTKVSLRMISSCSSSSRVERSHTRLFASSSFDPNPSTSEDATSKPPQENDQAATNLAVQGGLALAAIALVYVGVTSVIGLMGNVAQQAGTAVSQEVLREAGNVVSWCWMLLSGVAQLAWQAVSVLLPALWQALVALAGWAIPAAQTTAESVAPYIDQAAGQLATAAAPYVDQASTTVAPYVDQARSAVDAAVVAPLQTAVDTATAAVTTAVDDTVQSAANAVDDTVQSATASVDANLQSATESLQTAVQKAFSASSE